MPELPEQKRARYISQLGLTVEDARLLASDLSLASYFEKVNEITKDPAQTANWVKGELLARLNRENISPNEAPIEPRQLGDLILRVNDETISGKIAKTIFSALWHEETNSVDDYIDLNGLKQVSDNSTLEPIVDQIIADNPKQVGQFVAGKTKLLGFFVGQVMKQTGGTANPKQVNDLVVQRLKSAE